MKKIVAPVIILFILTISSCETKESKINSSKEVVMSFVTNLSFDNYDVLNKLYPSFNEINTYWKVKDFNITTAVLNDNTVTVVGKSENTEILFLVEKIDGDYLITKTKGLSSAFNSNIYKYCKKIGCIGQNNYDTDISAICEDKESEFNSLVKALKEAIETKVRMENHTVRRSYGMIDGDITLKNYSRFTLPAYSYNLYVVYTDGNGNTLFTSKEMSNYESIQFSQSKTIHVVELNSGSFRKVDINVKIISTEFIEEVIAEYAEGANCRYSNNL